MRICARSSTAVFVGLAMALHAAVAWAQGGPGGVAPQPGPASAAQSNVLQQVRFDQKLDARVPLDILFRDETGQVVPLGRFFGKRPVILALVYYECPMLCSQVLSGLVSALDILTFDAGKEFDVVAVSFNPKEGPQMASGKKQSYVERYNRPGTEAGWHFLTGPAESIAQLSRAVGFTYVWDEATKQFAHASGVMVLTPDGRLSRYFYGIEYAPRDLRFGIIQASSGKIGTPVDNLLLYCYHYDPTTGTYGLVVMRAVQIGGALTIATLVGFWMLQWRREPSSPPLSGAAGRS